MQDETQEMYYTAPIEDEPEIVEPVIEQDAPLLELPEPPPRRVISTKRKRAI